jgi:integrase
VRYLHRHPKTGTLTYRRRVPATLRPHVAGEAGEFVRTLAAREITAPGALDRFKAADREYEAMVARARKSSAAGVAVTFEQLTPDLIQWLADYYLAAELTADEQLRMGYPVLRLPYVGRRDKEQDWEDSREALSRYQGEALRAVWGDWPRQYASDMGYPIDPKDPSLGQLVEAIATAACELWLALDRRADASRGDGEPVASPPIPVAPAVADRTLGAADDTKNSFAAIAQAILNSPRLGVTISTRQSSAASLRFFRETHGSPTPAKITRAMVAEWLDLLAQRPAKLPKSDRALPLREVVELYQSRGGVKPKPLAAKTLKAHAGALAALWNVAVKEGQINEGRSNPFANHRVALPAPSQELPMGFSAEELSAVFALPIFTQGERPRGGKAHASYWMPLFMLWTGARPEEVAQLMVDDFRPTGDGGWTMTFTDLGIHPHKGQRRLKTTGKGSGRRTIPVPTALIELGLVAYVEHLKADNATALFPELRTKGARGLLATGWNIWWAKLIYAQGILSKDGPQRQPSREFRHTWTTAARTSEIPREVLEYAQGHKAAGGTANEGYGDLAPLGKQLAKLRFDGLDLSAVKVWEP